jgi:glucokinase
VVLGGGVALAGPALLEPLTAALRERLTFQAMPALVTAALGDDAAWLGAAIGAWDAISRRA